MNKKERFYFKRNLLEMKSHKSIKIDFRISFYCIKKLVTKCFNSKEVNNKVIILLKRKENKIKI